MNQQFIYGLMDETEANVLRDQFFLEFFRLVWDPYD